MTGLLLRAKRKKMELSQFAVAKMSKVSRYKISLFESGYDKLTEKEMDQIETAFKKQETKSAANNKKIKSK